VDIPSRRLAVYVTCAVWAGVDLAVIIVRGRKSDASADRGSLGLILIAIVVAVVIGNVTARLGALRLPGTGVEQGLVGIPFMWVGMALRWWAMLTLGRFFNPLVTIRHDHRVIRSGPYARIRHPAYAGSLITLVGLGVALGSWAGLIGMVLVLFLGFWLRMSREEEALTAALGQEYRDYMAQTKRLIPGIY
jgi:protein-S-isoprenylcysteine O-methyltransferase Ste14